MHDGVPLNADQTADAVKIGVVNAERVRLMKVLTVPIPEQRELRGAAERLKFLSPRTRGLTLRYGIFIRADCWEDRQLVFHELVHTMQFERLGGFQQFLKPYLIECATFEYPNGPLEQEAIMATARLCG